MFYERNRSHPPASYSPLRLRALLQRTADGAEIARTVMFFAGPESRNITGETLLSDGGLHLSMAGARR